MSTPQEYWDACLIKAWRNDGQLIEAFTMFQSITGKKTLDIEPPLLRVPHEGVPWKMRARVYMASHLEKISNRLWDQPPEKDVLLLRKLKDSKYTTTYQNTNSDKELAKEKRNDKKNKAIITLDTTKYEERNRATDWNVTQGPSPKSMRMR